MSCAGLVAVVARCSPRSARRRPPAAVTQPPQPKSGPGGSDYPHRGWRVSSGGSGSDAWYVFEPARPRPAGAAGDRHARLLRVLGLRPDVRADPAHRAQGQRRHLPALADRRRRALPGPVRHRAVHDVGGERHPRRPVVPARAAERRVQPRLGRTSYFGFSFGGIITANLANRLPGAAACRGRGRSSSTIRTTAASTGPTSRRSTTRWPASPRR